jgi:hypothetical protein
MAIYKKGQDDSGLRAAAKEDYKKQVHVLRQDNKLQKNGTRRMAFDTGHQNALHAGWKPVSETHGPVSGDELANSNYKKSPSGDTVQKFGRNGKSQTSDAALKARKDKSSSARTGHQAPKIGFSPVKKIGNQSAGPIGSSGKYIKDNE